MMLPNADAPIKSRLAPTPSGYLHLGNLANFLLTWLTTRQAGGRLLLRIDDLDAARVRTAYLDDIFNTLEWLGIDYDEGPGSVADFIQNWRQELRLPMYNQWLDGLLATEKLYACICSRSQIKARYANGLYGGFCQPKHLPLTTPSAQWRLDVAHAPIFEIPMMRGQTQSLSLRQSIGDPVVRKKDGQPSYQLASLTDDLHYGINLVVRGADLMPSTACQLYIHRLVTGNDPAIRFIHHPLLTDSTGAKLSKSDGALSIKYLRQQGASATQVLAMAATFMGWPQPNKPPAEAKDFLGVVDL